MSVTRSTTYTFRACTAKRVFFEFEPGEDDIQPHDEPTEDYYRRLCDKYGFEAIEEHMTQSVTHWVNEP